MQKNIIGINTKLKKLKWLDMPLVPAVEEGMDLSLEFQSSLVYRASPRTAKATQRNPDLGQGDK